jgi:hypothetical protein
MRSSRTRFRALPVDCALSPFRIKLNKILLDQNIRLMAARSMESANSRPLRLDVKIRLQITTHATHNDLNK